MKIILSFKKNNGQKFLVIVQIAPYFPLVFPSSEVVLGRHLDPHFGKPTEYVLISENFHFL